MSPHFSGYFKLDAKTEIQENNLEVTKSNRHVFERLIKMNEHRRKKSFVKQQEKATEREIYNALKQLKVDIGDAIVENNYKRHKLYVMLEECKDKIRLCKELGFDGLEAQFGGNVNVKPGSEEVTEADERPATTIEQTVTFSEDRQKVTDVRPTDLVHVTNDNPYFTESILQWISRPFPVQELTWTSSNSAGSRIAAIPFPSSLFTLNVVWDKIANFNYFKGGIKFSIRVNGTRFHYGKLLFMWSPQSLNTGKLFDLTDNIYSASGFPHVLVSPTDSEVHEIVMPFAIPFPWINMSVYAKNKTEHRYFDIGTVYVYVLNPLSVAGSSSVPDVNISCFANFVNPQLAGYSQTILSRPAKTTIGAQSFVLDPTTITLNFSTPSSLDLDCSDSLEAQMRVGDGSLLERTFWHKHVERCIKEFIENNRDVAYSDMLIVTTDVRANCQTEYDCSVQIQILEKLIHETSDIRSLYLLRLKLALCRLIMFSKDGLEAQMGISDENDPEGQQKSREGVISGVAERVATAANLFSNVPFLSPVANTVSGIATGVSKIARLFGYCNPLSQEMLTRMKLHMPLFTHSHGLDNAVSLTLTPDAKLAPGLELLGGFPEEQSLSYLCGTPSLLLVQKWQDSDTAFETLVTIPVCPMVTCQTTVPSGVQVAIPTVLSFATHPFAFWRGSLRYYITVTCSAFHSGRLKISWSPDYIKTSTQTASSYVQVSHILDIQSETDFSFTIPWLKHLVYAPLFKYNQQNDTSAYNGFITISVVNPTTAPQSPIGDLYINVYVSACDDFQLNYVNTEKIYLPDEKVKTSGLEAQWSVETKDEPSVMWRHCKQEVLNELIGFRVLYESVMSHSEIQQLIELGVPAISFIEFFNFANEIELCAEKMELDLEAQFMTRETIRSMEYKPLIPASGTIEKGVVFGETPESIKDVMKRSTPAKVIGKNVKVEYNPFGRLPVEVSTTPAADKIVCSFVMHYRQLYRYSRGSLVLRVMNIQDFDNLSAAVYMTVGGQSSEDSGLNFYMSSPSAITDSSVEERYFGNGCTFSSWNHIQPVEGAIPYFSNVFGGVNCFSDVSSDQYKYARYPKAEFYAIGAESDKTTTTHGIFVTECAGDDFELMFQVGPPLLAMAKL